DSFVKSDETKVLRIIDYKTGNDDPAVGNNWQQKILRDNTAVFQLLFYCEVVRQLKHEYEYKHYQLKPLIYQVRNIPVEGVIKDITFNGTVVDNYDDYRDEFRSILFDIVEEIFDKEKPFDQSSYKNGRWDEQAPYAFDTKSCKFCNFQFICNKKVDNNSY
ncbi:MAG: PD-(D/E)XK nuclease family protein, partial [Muribaculaceae bacterium]|nr:PD-(D/E)XK nuclease family protein [Muribaculaceae bacterium]